MNIPSLSANNYYAFCCTLGLAILFFSIVVPGGKVSDLGQLVGSITLDVALAKSESEHLQKLIVDENEQLIKSTKRIEKFIRMVASKEASDREIVRLTENIEKEDTKRLKNKTIIAKLDYEIKKKFVYLKHQSTTASHYLDESQFYLGLGAVIGFMGFGLFIANMIKWANLQKKYDAKIDDEPIKKTKAALACSKRVHYLQRRSRSPRWNRRSP